MYETKETSDIIGAYCTLLELTSNRALQKALEQPDTKQAMIDILELSLGEIKAIQKKTEL